MVPRPFADEALGSWFGRIASRYGMNVDELATAGQLNFDFGDCCRDWLLIPPISAADRVRLAFLTGVREELLPRPYTGPLVTHVKTRVAFCEKCLWLNPLDISAPYWKAQWADQIETTCQVHGREFDYVSGTELIGCKNMRRLLAYLSKRARKRRLAQSLPWLR